MDQVEDYGNVILETPQFASSTAHWDFILVTGDYDSVVKNRIKSQGADFETGKFWAPDPTGGQPRATAYVRRWRDIIDENRRRINYLASIIQHDPGVAEGLSYVRDKYADLIPSALLGAGN